MCSVLYAARRNILAVAGAVGVCGASFAGRCAAAALCRGGSRWCGTSWQHERTGDPDTTHDERGGESVGSAVGHWASFCGDQEKLLSRASTKPGATLLSSWQYTVNVGQREHVCAAALTNVA